MTLYEERIFERLCAALEGSADYKGEVKRRFRRLLFLLVKFVGIRINASGEMFHYLQAFSAKKDAPHEHELQMDLYAFLASNGYAEIEITAVSSGRVDIYLPQPGFRFIVEVKRTFEEWGAELHKFVGQTAAYQQTDVRLGVLSVLDLTARKAGEPHFDRCFEVHDSEFASDDKRRVVVMRVPGNRRPPSLQTAVVAIK